MINADETKPPVVHVTGRINTDETQPPAAEGQETYGRILAAGDLIGDGYVIHSNMERRGGQSDVYLAKKDGRSYVIKVYRGDWRPDVTVQRFLTSTNHPNIARTVECEDKNGSYYEVYEYYSEGTLEDREKLPVSVIQKVVVPSINEGLHELHRNGIIHCDIKPSNLFFSDDENRIIIGDCGISAHMDSAGMLIDSPRGTPEYAPRVKTLGNRAVMTAAYDYGSFGLVLCRAVMGRSLFAGMSEEEISRTWEEGLTLPGQISGRLGTLIRGLLLEDEEGRWGYEQVRRWCEGEFVREDTRTLYGGRRKTQTVRPLIFGRFEGQTLSVSTLHQLAQAVKLHWEQATKVIRRNDLYEFMRQFDSDIAEKIKELSREKDPDVAVYKLLTAIEDGDESIFFCGKEYRDMEEYVESLASGKDDIAKKFLMSGPLIIYLRNQGRDENLVNMLESQIKRSGFSDMVTISTICRALQGKRTIEVKGVTIDDLASLIPVLTACTVKEIDEILQTDEFIAWLNRLGYEREMHRMKEDFG